ncbi:primary amine oxidase [Bryobacterales bacterium F-183]|nr:primary amine oxidase [Bryobacterales bacterium F-183]
MRVLLLLLGLATFATAQAPVHPLDALTSNEYWNVYDTLATAGHATPDTIFSSVLLHPPSKSLVLTWRPGQPIPRQADVILLRGAKSYTALVDVAARRVVRFDELKGPQAPFVTSELIGMEEVIKSDPRVIEAMKKRGITDMRHVQCFALPVAYRAIPEQATQRIGFASCSMTHRVYRGWGRSIEGLSIPIDITARKVLRVDDTGGTPIPTGGNTNYEDIPEVARPNTTSIATVQPQGTAYRIDKGEISWQDWRFRMRIDPRVGTVLNLVRFVDKGKPRSVMYEGSVSELFVPYMDPATGWNNRAFIDAGQFYGTGGHLKPLRPDLDCPARATWFDAFTVGENGAPKRTANMACLFERNLENPAWRHAENGEIQGRPARQLVLRSAAVIGNYDYIMDWRFEQDGTIEVAVGATGIIETKPVKEKTASSTHDHTTTHETGQFVAPNTLGVNHDHYFSYRLDLDVDGPANSFMLHRLVPKRIENDPMRKSIWVLQPSTAQREKDAILDIRADSPAMWMFMNPSTKGPLNYETGYEVMPGATAKSLMSADDPVQKIGAFSAHAFWVTPYKEDERYASGTYPTSSDANEGLAVWTQANRPIVNTDIVGWYTLGFHHVPRAEDWPVMPVMWHHFHIRPFHFFQSNPVLDLPKTLQ